MSQPISISELIRYVKTLLENDRLLSSVWVSGEISNFKAHTSGHYYFVLKDDKAQVSCVMFRGQNSALRFKPENGMQVMARCRASMFERAGSFQLYVSEMEPMGVGDLHLAFEQLKERLNKEGLFDAGRKRVLPLLPSCIGVITSGSGAVIRDILHVLHRRFPSFRLILYPVPVQGAESAPAIVRAIRYMNEKNLADVLIVGRGGGSMEDLWSFNEEIVARAIVASEIPVVSAVGHETDFTIADFVADVRAPTPSAAAEIVLPQRDDLVAHMMDMKARMRRNLLQRLDHAEKQLERCTSSRFLMDPREMIHRRQMTVDLLSQRLLSSQRSRLSSVDRVLSHVCGKLDALSPLKVLARGYGMVSIPDSGKSILSVDQLQPNDLIYVTLSDGRLHCRVNRIEEKGSHQNG